MNDSEVNNVLRRVFEKRPSLRPGFLRLSFVERTSILASVATLIQSENMHAAELTMLEWFK